MDVSGASSGTLHLGDGGLKYPVVAWPCIFEAGFVTRINLMILGSGMSRAPRARVSTMVLLAGWLVVCLLCQRYPDTAHAHHASSSDLDRGCLIVAEAAPVGPSQWLVESRRCADQTEDPFLAVPPSSGVVFGSVRLAFQRDAPSSLRPPSKLYQLHRVYRL